MANDFISPVDLPVVCVSTGIHPSLLMNVTILLVGQNKSLDFFLFHEQKHVSKICHPPVSELKGTEHRKENK